MIKIQNYIYGNLLDAQREKFFETINPALDEAYALVPDSSSEDIEQAVQAAKEAFPSWSETSRLERSECLLKLANAIEENFEEFARAESIDNGKPISLARSVDIPRSIENLKYFAKEILRFGEERFDDQGMGENTVYYSPLGVVACISPWNLPLYLFTWKIAPALASGCTVVAKPSEVTPMTAFMLSKIAKDILPPGVLNIVHGTGAQVGSAINTHPDIQAISFTGSTATGKIIAKQASETMKRLHLEMGGKNPTVVFADCEFDKAIDHTLRSSFANQGQICLCGSRIYVEKSLYPKFKEVLVAKVNELIQGDPLDEKTQQGAVVSKAHFEKVMSAIEKAKSEGGKILTGGGRFGERGFFIMPTLIEGLSESCQTNLEEIFGPVATLQPFESEDEVIALANSTRYGLAGSIWTQDIKKAKRVARKISSGIMWINTWLMRDLRTPFGGMKDSGRGREGGQYILKFFSNVQNICLNNKG
ncbi:MAG: 2-hydroxymuconic semialdehyde dehydrogenase [Halobacteriovoraceae bacterium]|nr:2-hydroxymuconic semialdehyde dehydrogenase [Halobacteriovoraceae bacterium]